MLLRVNHLAAEFFVLPSNLHGDNFLHTITWHGYNMLLRVNHLAEKFFLLPSNVHRDNFLYTFTWHGLYFSMFTVWHGLFSLVLIFPRLRIEAPPYLQYRVSVYTQFLKQRTRKFDFRSYVPNLI